MTLLSALRDPRRTPEAEAVRVADASLSWAQLRTAASAFAKKLSEDTADAPVAVCAQPTLETVVAVTGCLLAGVPAVPIAPDSGPTELAHLLCDSGATRWAGPTRAGVDLPRCVVDLQPADVVSLPDAIEESVIGTILYTSGTTGAPKGVLMSQRAMRVGIEGVAQAWGWTDSDTVAHGLPLFHTHGLVLGILGGLHLGSRTVHTGKPTPERYAAAAADATMFFAVPTIWARIVANPQSARQLSKARLLVSGSAPLPVTVFNRLRELTGHAPVERYGMTETMMPLSTRVDGERRPGWVGLPVVGAETRIRGADGGLAPADGEALGQLEVRGELLFDGYLDLPEVTAAAMTDDGWFKTGDIAVADVDGFHRIVGRESVDLIKSGGYRIGAGEIENSLLGLPAVAEVAVVGELDDDLGQRIVAHVVVAAQVSADDRLAAALVAHVAADLSWHKRPREVRFVESLPRNHMGKVQKKQLLQGASR